MPFLLLSSPGWKDYELLDSGNGLKLERFGSYRLVRPEPEAIWKPAWGEKEWRSAHATFIPGKEEMGGHWQMHVQIPPRWKMDYGGLKFWAQLSMSKHVGVFPEQACQWDWMTERIRASKGNIKVLNLFGYSGIATLAAAQAGAQVTHLDASRKVVSWARENQALSGLENALIRWIVDDAVKFVQREGRRGVKYDGLILDPPKFGRGPKGEVWEFYRLIPDLLAACRDVLSREPIFVILTAYAVKASAVTLYHAVREMMDGFGGEVSAGEVTLEEKSAGRVVSLAIFARWTK
jgi:23S rRNA (cytosine1962-C5)-methyltransferase